MVAAQCARRGVRGTHRTLEVFEPSRRTGLAARLSILYPSVRIWRDRDPVVRAAVSFGA
jgi:hypothetical protein